MALVGWVHRRCWTMGYMHQIFGIGPPTQNWPGLVRGNAARLPNMGTTYLDFAFLSETQMHKYAYAMQHHTSDGDRISLKAYLEISR